MERERDMEVGLTLVEHMAQQRIFPRPKVSRRGSFVVGDFGFWLGA